MIRIAAVAAIAFALPAAGQGLFEMDPAKIQAGWKREKLEQIRKGDPKERAEAAKYLGGNKDAESIAALTQALADPEARVRQEAASGLWSSEKAAEPARAALQALLDDPDPNVVTQAAGALQALGMKEAELADARKRALDHPQATPFSRYLLARNLVGHEAPAKLVEPTVSYLERNAAARDPPRASIESAQRTLERLVRTQDRTIIPALLEAARSMKAGNAVVLKALGGFKPEVDGYLDLVTGQLQSPHPRMRVAALEILRDMKDERQVAAWVPRVAPLLRDAEEDVRSAAAWTMGRAAGLAAPQLDALVAALSDPSNRVRRSTVNALGYVGEAKQAMAAADRARVLELARPALQHMSESDADNDVRRDAKEALNRIGTDATPPAQVFAAPASADAEAKAMALLRSRNIRFEPDMYQRALYERDVDVVRAFLDAGMSPKAKFDMGRSPLWLALFDPGACDPGQRPTNPRTKAVVQLLIERGAEADAADDHGNTPLMAATTRGCDREVMRMLLEAGARIGAVNSAGLTPFEHGLHSAHDGLEEIIAAGYRMPPDKVKLYQQGYADRPAAQAMIRKASGTAPPAAPAKATPAKATPAKK